MRLRWHVSEPQTMPYRLQRMLAQWHVKRIMRSYCHDPLTLDERVAADWRLSCKREIARDWLRRKAHAVVRPSHNVLIFGKRNQ